MSGVSAGSRKNEAIAGAPSATHTQTATDSSTVRVNPVRMCSSVSRVRWISAAPMPQSEMISENVIRITVAATSPNCSRRDEPGEHREDGDLQRDLAAGVHEHPRQRAHRAMGQRVVLLEARFHSPSSSNGRTVGAAASGATASGHSRAMVFIGGRACRARVPTAPRIATFEGGEPARAHRVERVFAFHDFSCPRAQDSVASRPEAS